MKKIIATTLSLLLLLSFTVISSDAGMVTGNKELVLSQKQENPDEYSIFTYAFDRTGEKAFKIELASLLEIKISEDESEFYMDYETMEFVVNYFLDDYFFCIKPLGWGSFEPYFLIDKDNKIIVNQAFDIKEGYSFMVSSKYLEKFGISSGRTVNNEIFLIKTGEINFLRQ